ncbi:hypothetical protein [Burkholderia thailandensis]|nr:hypothetical protein [Burkholderia thailandensis]MDW9235824.1 hypothetical protein [Burkholderia thailandensis]
MPDQSGGAPLNRKSSIAGEPENAADRNESDEAKPSGDGFRHD